MRLAIASDLHIDIGSQEKVIWPEADVYVIAGDTANSIGSTIKGIKRAARNHKGYILVTDGNHEHYNNTPQKRTINDTLEKLKRQLPENAHLLQTGEPSVVIDGTAFIGCNGWYTGDYVDEYFHEDFWKRYMNDYDQIFKIEKRHPTELALEAANHIDHEVQTALDKGLKVVVITHTAPSRHCVMQKPWDMDWQKANGFYFNSFNDKLLAKYGDKISLWIHGHIHDRKEIELDGVRILANPRGYPREFPGSKWEPLVLEV